MSLTRRAAVAALAALFGPLACASDAFVFTNPVLGPTPAPVTVEYFGAVGCPGCDTFEREVLPVLVASAQAGRLRLIFRDLAPADPSVLPLARDVYCLQERPDLVERRRALKAQVADAPVEPDTALARARDAACRGSGAADRAFLANRRDLEAAGFRGTPAVIVTLRAADRPAARLGFDGRASRRAELVRLVRTLESVTVVDSSPP
jgi:hypothetical protein